MKFTSKLIITGINQASVEIILDLGNFEMEWYMPLFNSKFGQWKSALNYIKGEKIYDSSSDGEGVEYPHTEYCPDFQDNENAIVCVGGGNCHFNIFNIGNKVAFECDVAGNGDGSKLKVKLDSKYMEPIFEKLIDYCGRMKEYNNIIREFGEDKIKEREKLRYEKINEMLTKYHSNEFGELPKELKYEKGQIRYYKQGNDVGWFRDMCGIYQDYYESGDL